MGNTFVKPRGLPITIDLPTALSDLKAPLAHDLPVPEEAIFGNFRRQSFIVRMQNAFLQEIGHKEITPPFSS
jgi:hypothetical protein